MIRKKFGRILFSAVFFIFCYYAGQSQQQGNVKNPPKYELVSDWPQLPVGYPLSQPSGIGVDISQHIFVFHRPGRRWKILDEEFPDSLISSNTILMLDRHTGKILDSWGANMFIMPHGLTVDKDNNVWVTDVGLHQVFKFSHDGKLLMKLGEARVPGNDSLHFNRPTDVAIAADGSFYVSDGYRNSRVVKFSASGEYLFEWGRKGDKPGEFHIPHSIDIDSKGNVYVADRQNDRIQEFDAGGRFLKQWKNKTFANLYAVRIDKRNQHVFAVDYLILLDTIIKGSNIMEFDQTGSLIARFGRSGSYNGPLCRYHDIAVDNEGSIYVGDILGNRIQKFKLVSRK
jgi:peptidylamidoglycolate lyase